MKLTKEKAKENLAKLVDKFKKELDAHKIYEYNEEATKMAFIQPLLKDVLGWDVNNRDEVSPEEKVSHGRVDYGLKLDGKIKIFIEAKPPKKDIDAAPVMEQAIRYGYSRKDVPFILLTDFEGFKLFDVTIKPDLRNPHRGLTIDLRWPQYLEKFEKIWSISKESVINGELDKLLLTKPKARLFVDEAILKDLKNWRETLSKDIFKNNPELFHSGDKEKAADYLKEITQRILDRIIFMRSCEDRRLAPTRTLKEIFEERVEGSGISAMVFLKETFKRYNQVFNSDLFCPQEWEDSLKVDFELMFNIIVDTYNPYEFSVIPIEVLGNIYEQYLGYTIKLTDHQVRYELKPDVRKAGGVYYTPEYIVDYIVKNTVGKLLQESSPTKIKKLRILDPACGSGSFLIRAYEEMLSYYQDQKARQLKLTKRKKKLDIGHEEIEPRLSIYEKRKILQDHIFGVDIDEQAVEVTKLSLMLKMLEEEFGAVSGQALLPMLDENIQCGNSLISGETLELKKYFGNNLHEINPFNWDKRFKKIIVEEGGFDVVIGNPPYVRPHKLNQSMKSCLWEYYRPIFEAKSDLYACFIKRALDLLKLRGLMSFIVSKTWLSLESFTALRQYVLAKTAVRLIALPPKKVFDNATVETVVVALERENSNEKRAKNKIKIVTLDQDHFVIDKEITQKVFSHTHLNVFDLSVDKFTSRLNEKMQNNSLPLTKCVQFFYGLKTGDDSKFITTEQPTSKYKKLLRRSDFFRYGLRWDGEYVWYVPDKMRKNRETARPGTPERFELPKIMVLDIAKKIVATIDREKYYVKDALLFLRKGNFKLKYVLGVLNSQLMNYYYAKTFTTLSVAKNAILTLPIRTINFSKLSEKKNHDNLVELVDIMLDLNRKVQTTKGTEKDHLQRQIEKTDKEIDDIVYKLYGITEDERKIIESRE